MRTLVALVLLTTATGGLAACGDDSEGSAPPELDAEQREDESLVAGEALYAGRCARCHGAAGEGGNAPSLQRVSETYPDIAEQIAVITAGRGGMPAFGAQLSEDEIEAVARYEREVL